MASDDIAAFEPAIGSDRLRTSVRLVFICVFLVLASVLAASLAFNHREALDYGERRAENLALILRGHFSRTVAGIDTTLRQVALVSSRIGGPQASQQTWSGILDAAKEGVAGIAGLFVLDDTGTIRHSTLPQLVGQPRTDTPMFRQLSGDPNAGLMVNTPMRGVQSGRWVIPFGRRLAAPDGSFAGIVAGTVEPERLRDFYRTIDVGRRGFITIVQPENGTLFREPPTEDGASSVAADSALLAQYRKSPEAGLVRAPFDAGGPVYFTAYRQLADPPVLIAVSLSERDILATWWASVATSALILAGFGILLIFAWRVIMREIRARAGVETRVLAQARELTAALAKRGEADAALRANQVQFQSIMDHAPVMVSLKDLSGRFTFINRAYIAFVGRREEDVLGRTIGELQPKDIGDVAAAQDRSVIEGKESEQWEMTLPTPNGPRTVLVAKFPVYDEAGQMASLGTVLTDVTEQKRIETQLTQAQRIEAIGQLSGGIAHDFNNLLTSILLNADVLASVLDEKLRPLAEAVRSAAERGADLTRRLLAFGRRQMLEPRPTNVKDLLAGMEPLMRRTLGEHIEIRSRHAADLWSATVDPGQLENAVLNLAVNARDAMPNGGQLSIETANVEIGVAPETAEADIKPGKYVMIAVADTGIGMTPEVIERAFEPFFTTKDVGKGTGLGLSMVYGFVKQSGGHARIVSEVGKGTVVRLYLPRSDIAATTATLAPAANAELPTGKETILFVEDDPMVRQHTGRQIVGLGYDVIAAENAVDALALVDNGCEPDLLFTDVVMPGGMNGRQLALRLRERWPGLRVLYTSGYAHGALTIDGEAVPTKYVLGKPYRRRDLAAKLREVLDEPAG